MKKFSLDIGFRDAFISYLSPIRMVNSAPPTAFESNFPRTVSVCKIYSILAFKR